MTPPMPTDVKPLTAETIKDWTETCEGYVAHGRAHMPCYTHTEMLRALATIDEERYTVEYIKRQHNGTRAERDRLREENARLTRIITYAFHSVRASLSYAQERNAAAAEIALKMGLPDEDWRPLMGHYGYLECDVREHLRLKEVHDAPRARDD